MCGIITVRTKNPKKLVKVVKERYEKQKSRGSQGFGFVAIRNNKVVTVKRAQDEKAIMSDLKKVQADTIIFHHRYPTSTPNLAEMAHPITIDNANLSNVFHVVHNGIISNADELQEQHEKRGFTYSTSMFKKTKWVTQGQMYWSKTDYFNDSESFAVELALFLSGKKKTIDSKGSIAFVAVESTRAGQVVAIHYGRNDGNPLGIKQAGNVESVCSEGGTDIEPNIIYTERAGTGLLETQRVAIGDYPKQTFAYSNYSNYGYSKGAIWSDDYASNKTQDMSFSELEREREQIEIELDSLKSEWTFADPDMRDEIQLEIDDCEARKAEIENAQIEIMSMYD